MAKRKGSDFGNSPAVAVVVHNAATEAKEWEATESLMEQLRAQFDSENGQCDVANATAQRCHTKIVDIKDVEEILRDKARIETSIRAKIDSETKSLGKDSDVLAQLERHVQNLLEEMEEFTERNADIIAKRRSAEHNIPLYKAEASEEIEKLDEVEIQRMREVPRAKMNHSLFAQLTKIKWDYSRTDVLAGEVALPRKFTVRKFEIDKDLPRFEIAQKLWQVIEGL